MYVFYTNKYYLYTYLVYNTYLVYINMNYVNKKSKGAVDRSWLLEVKF